MNRRLVPALALLLSLSTSVAVAKAAEAVVIIVNKSNKTDNLTSRMLRDIFSGQTVKWPDGRPIQTLASSPDTPEHTVAISFLFKMTEAQYRQYLQETGAAANSSQSSRDSGTPQAVVNLVGLIPGAISFARQSLVTSGVKVLKIDGLSPGNPGYPLIPK